MNHRFIACGAGMLWIAASAGATFTGFSHNETVINNLHVVDIWATYTSTDDVLLAINGVNVEFEQGFAAFEHSDFIGGTWAPQFAANPSQDSFVTIGGEPIFANSTNGECGWGPAGFNQIPIPDAGWFNANPPNLQGKAQMVTLQSIVGCITYSGPATRIMRVVYTPSVTGNQLTITAVQTNNQGAGTPSQHVEGLFCRPLGALGATECPADVTCDFFVDAADVGVILANWGVPGVGDVNRDGIVDAADLGAALWDVGVLRVHGDV